MTPTSAKDEELIKIGILFIIFFIIFWSLSLGDEHFMANQVTIKKKYLFISKLTGRN